MAPDTISFVRLPRGDEATRAVADCFVRNGLPRRDDIFRWQYLEPPVDRFLVMSAVSSKYGQSRLAAIYATLPVWMKIGGRKALALQSFDTLTDAEFRGTGLFVQMAKEVYERVAPAEGFEGIFGTPNGNSAHGIFERLGWTRLDPVPFMVKPLRTGAVVRRLFNDAPLARLLPDVRLTARAAPRLCRGQSIGPLTRFDSEVDALWDRFSARISIAVWRDAQYLRWRVRRPGANYVTLAFRERDVLLGLVVFSTGDAHADGFGHVCELMIDPTRPEVGRALLRTATRAMAVAGSQLALAWSLPAAPNHSCFSRVGFMPIPTRFHPIETHFGARSFGPPSPTWVRRDGWYLSYLDADTS
jgi:hypothetical protein